MQPPAGILDELQILVALLLLGLALPCLPRAYGRAYAVWRAERDAHPKVVALATALAAIVRWFVAPKWIVTMYIGYQLTDHALTLSTWSRYGIGSQALYHALFAFLPHDHAYLLWTNAVLGVMAIPLVATVAARILRDRRAGAITALLVALVPLFIKNDNSDANNVPLHLWLMGGLVLWDEYLEGGALGALVPAVVLFALAAISRPEMPVLLPVLVAILTFGLAPPRARVARPAVAIGALAFLLLVLPHALHVRGAVDVLRESDSLPGFTGPGVLRMFRILFSTRDTALAPSLYPIVLVPLAAYGVLDPAQRRARVAIVVGALASLAIYSLDLCRANMARVHILGCLWITMLAAAGLSRLWDRRPSLAVRAGSAAAIAIAAVPTVFVLWAPTNEQAEEVFLREAIARLPRSGAFTLLRFGAEDRDAGSRYANFTHPYFPDYLVTPPVGTGEVRAIRPWLRDPKLDVPVYFYAGFRCYAEFRPDGSPPPHGESVQPACAEIRREFRLVPVVEEDAPNRGDVWLNYYGDAKTLRIGLYRVERLDPAPVSRGE